MLIGFNLKQIKLKMYLKPVSQDACLINSYNYAGCLCLMNAPCQSGRNLKYSFFMILQSSVYLAKRCGGPYLARGPLFAHPCHRTYCRCLKIADLENWSNAEFKFTQVSWKKRLPCVCLFDVIIWPIILAKNFAREHKVQMHCKQKSC